MRVVPLSLREESRRESQVKAIICQDRAVRLRWEQHPEEMPKSIKRVVRMARELNRRIIAETTVELLTKR